MIIYKDKKLQPVTMLATYFQRSPLILIVQPEIKTVLDLVGKRIAISENNRYKSDKNATKGRQLLIRTK